MARALKTTEIVVSSHGSDDIHSRRFGRFNTGAVRSPQGSSIQAFFRPTEVDSNATNVSGLSEQRSVTRKPRLFLIQMYQRDIHRLSAICHFSK